MRINGRVSILNIHTPSSHLVLFLYSVYYWLQTKKV